MSVYLTLLFPELIEHALLRCDVESGQQQLEDLRRTRYAFKAKGASWFEECFFERHSCAARVVGLVAGLAGDSRRQVRVVVKSARLLVVSVGVGG